MEYKTLEKLYHIDDSSDRESNLKKELERRLCCHSSFRLGYRTDRGDELFVAVPRGLSLLEEKVLRAERRVSLLMRSVPGIASNAILRNLVLDEVVSSNAIESIHSTRREIAEALDEGPSDGKPHRRFHELARLYMDIVERKARLPESPSDVREIYDRVMDGDLSEKDAPDGKLFRTGGVEVSNGLEALHHGLEPESKITEAIQAMLDIATSDDVPSLYGAIASHYLFEYAHPFYDGNGRTGRYLLALFLGEPLSLATSLSLSRVIYENKNAYYRAFEIAQNPLNHGELTHFVFALLQMTSKSQDDMLECLQRARKKVLELDGLLGRYVESNGLRENEANALFILMQREVFGGYAATPLSFISDNLKVSRQMTRQYLKKLEENSAVRRVRKRDPITFALTDEFKKANGVRSFG